MLSGYAACFFDEAFCGDGFLRDEADAAEGDAADEPFGVDDVRQDADGRDEHPGDEDDDRSEDGPECSLFRAVLRCVHGHDDDHGESRHQGKAGHESSDDAADGQGEAQRQKTEEQDGQARDAHVLLIGHLRIDELFVDIVGIERRSREEQVAGRADIGGPEGRERDAGDPRIQGHDQFRQCRRRRDGRIHFCSDDTEESGDEADRQHDQAADDKAAAGRLDVFGAKGNLDDGLQRKINRNQDDNPGDDGHRTDTGNEIKGRNGRCLDGDDVDAAGHTQDEEGSDRNTDVLERDVKDIGLARRPHTADKGNADEDDGTGEHARDRREDVRHQGRKDSAASDVLEAHDDQLYQDLAANAGDHAAAVIIAFQQFRYRRDVELAVFLSDRQTHDDGTDTPGGRIPAGGNADLIGLFGNTDGRSPADSQADDGDHDQRRRQLAAGQDIIFCRRSGAALNIPADAEENANVHNDDEDLNPCCSHVKNLLSEIISRKKKPPQKRDDSVAVPPNLSTEG